MSKLTFFAIVSFILAGCGLATKSRLESEIESQIAGVVTATPPQLPAPPVLKSTASELSLQTTALVVYDIASQQIFYSKNPDLRLMPASTTKIMTMLVALENYHEQEVVTVSRGSNAVGHAVDVEADDHFRAIDLIKAMIIESGNDTAVSLADHFPTGYRGFVNVMNNKAQALGLKNTHFTNVSGVEEDNHYSSAADLAHLAAYAIRDERVKNMVSTKTAAVKTIDNKRSYLVENTNELLGEVEGVVGIKTGWTPAAGECLVTLIDREHDVITVVLQSHNRFEDTKTLIDWVYESFEWPVNPASIQ